MRYIALHPLHVTPWVILNSIKKHFDFNTESLCIFPFGFVVKDRLMLKK